MRVVLVLGQAQTGKTTLAWRLLKRLAPRVLALDPVRSKPLTAAVSQRDAVAFLSWAALASFLAGESQPRNWRAVLRSPEENDYAMTLHMAPYFRHVTILADEALWLFGSAANTPLIKCSRANAHFGGGIGVPLWLTAQRPMDIPPSVRSQADQIISFRQAEPRDLGFLSERCTPDFAECVAALGPHQWAAYPPLPDVERGSEHAERQGDYRGGNRRAAGDGDFSGVPESQRNQQAAPDWVGVTADSSPPQEMEDSE